LLYYKIINEYSNSLLGGLNTVESILYTVNFEEIEILQHNNKWEEATEILIDGCIALERAGTDFIVICTNTMHKLLPDIKKEINIPFLHIAKATSEAIKRDSVKRVLLLGTKFTMIEAFYKSILIDEGIEVLIPKSEDIEIIHKIIYNELCLGKVKEASKKEYLRIINSFKDIEGVILGCTEIGMLISQNDLGIKVYDTTQIHAKEAVNRAIEA
jgi:aspartate racemase